jgi:hypothetical protein
MKSADAKTDTIRLALAKQRVLRALGDVQEAQDALDRASAELSAIQYAHPAQKRVGALRDRVHAEWYRVARLRDDLRIRIDRDPTPEERAAFNDWENGRTR